MKNKSKQKGMNFSDISNTSGNMDEEASVNSPQNTRGRNPRFYINYSLCPYDRFLYGKIFIWCRKVSFTIFGFQMVP